jgi:hypothetical protein
MCGNKKLSVMTESLQRAKQQAKKFKKQHPVKILFYGAVSNLKAKNIVVRSGLHSVSLNQIVVLCTMGVSTWIFQ